MKVVIRALLALSLVGCHATDTSDTRTQAEQERLMGEALAQAATPSIINFRERKLMKMLFELRDKELKTHTYLYAEPQGKFVYLGPSIGFGIPGSTQYTNPQQFLLARDHMGGIAGVVTLPQADPNGLFMPTSSDGTWVMLAGPNGPAPAYIEERILVLTNPLPPALVLNQP